MTPPEIRSKADCVPCPTYRGSLMLACAQILRGSRAFPALLACLSLACLSLVVLPGLAMAKDDGNPAYADPAKAPQDYQLQGEYQGRVTLSEAGDQVELGFQIIAMGEGKFGLVSFVGGLPGSGGQPTEAGMPGSAANPIMGELQGDEVVFIDNGGRGVLKEGQLAVYLPDGKDPVGVLQKVERKSPTLGAAAPEGAIVLFDGGSADAFENGKVVDGLLAATGCVSKQKFGDHRLHIEFRTPFMPKSRGQARGNSGVYVQGRYEVQVLDSFGLEGKSNECGGIYRISEPAVNMCFPPLSWQTYDIDFTAARYNEQGEKLQNARITVRHNGVVIHDNIELPNNTPGFHQEGPGPDSLFLQDHGNPVFFRNIWVVEK